MKNLKTLSATFASATLLATLLASQPAVAKDVIITKKELPAKATQFINTHFKDQETRLIEKDIDFASKSYKVTFANNIEVEFTGSGEWEEVNGHSQTIPTGFILAPIKNYVATNYKDATITKIEKDFRRFEVKLSSGVELEFSSTGDFIRIDY